MPWKITSNKISESTRKLTANYESVFWIEIGNEVALNQSVQKVEKTWIYKLIFWSHLFALQLPTKYVTFICITQFPTKDVISKWEKKIIFWKNKIKAWAVQLQVNQSMGNITAKQFWIKLFYFMFIVTHCCGNYLFYSSLFYCTVIHANCSRSRK